MEEVDKIIIDSLKALNCDFDDDLVSLKQFQADNIINALSTCLEVINPTLKLPKRMPESMSMKLKLATNLVEHVQNAGFRGDIGYQSILYSNDIELRRVLMFLLEHLPRENNKILVSDTIGYVPRLVKQIEEKVKLSLQTSWLPANICDVKKVDRIYIKQSYGGSIPLQTEFIKFPHCNLRKIDDEDNKFNRDMQNYIIHHLPPVTQQCKRNNLYPSLLFKDNEFTTTKELLSNEIPQGNNEIDEFQIPIIPISSDIDNTTTSNELEGKNAHTNDTKEKINNIILKIKASTENYQVLQEDVKNLQTKRDQLEASKINEKDELKSVMNKLNVKSKTLTVLSKEENMAKLKNLVDNGNVRLLDLANQWNEVQTPLIEQYKSLKSSLSEQELKLQEEKDKLSIIKEQILHLDEEIAEKEKFEKYLLSECEKINKANSRAGYTRRILEIIGNIKKQDVEINKILRDTKIVQKEISSLTGQLERSFTLCDTMIFNDAKHDEVSRKSYKLLASLHFDCETVIEAVTSIGQIEREIRNLQDQIDGEMEKDITTKLERVNQDIEDIRKESAI